MTLAERHNTILELLKQRGSILVSDLAEILKVSSVTIRKDLTLLEEKKMLYRTHGSAILINPYINDRNVSEKEKLNPEEKQAIGKAAASLIIPDDSIIIASGTTMFFLAREIRPSDHLTVITSSINVTSILARQHNIDIIQLGGLVRNSSVSVVSEYAVKMLENFSCSKLFIGVDGIDPNYGLTTTNLLEASLNRGYDTGSPENHRPDRFLQVRSQRFRKNMRSGSNRSDHYGRQSVAPHCQRLGRKRNRNHYRSPTP